jgi:hypothetical protein
MNTESIEVIFTITTPEGVSYTGKAKAEVGEDDDYICREIVKEARNQAAKACLAKKPQ